jgi:general secretion pathway protein J
VDNRGFTLAEILIASTLSSFIALAALGALKAVTDSSQVVNRATETAAEVRFAARMMARDLANLYRDPDPKSMKLVGASQESDAGGPVMLTFYAAGCTKARAGQAEGDVYEVEYFLGKGNNPDVEEEEEKFVLFRRLWPNPDKEREPGGILTPIAENIDVFQMRFYDGQQWVSEWREELQSIPEVVEVTLVTQPTDRGSPVIEKFTISFPRLAARTAAASGEGQQGEGGSGQQPPQGQPQAEGNQGSSGSPEQR